MKDLIRREDVLRAFGGSIELYRGDFRDYLREVIKKIENIPSVDSDDYDRCANCKHDESTMCEDCTTKGGRFNSYVVRL